DPVAGIEMEAIGSPARGAGGVAAEAVGLVEIALRRERGESTINLCPPAILAAERSRGRWRALGWAAALLVLAFALPGVHASRFSAAQTHRARAIEETLAPVRALRDRNERNLERLDALAREQALL